MYRFLTHEFPRIGKDIGAAPVLRRLIEAGHNLILFTMRSDIKEAEGKEYTMKAGSYLTDAVNWFKENKIELYGINENPTQKKWTKSPKAYGQLYIDDAALCVPTIINTKISNRPFVNWEAVERELETIGVLPKTDK